MQVTVEDAKKFGQVWTHHGVAILQQDVHYQFATDFANIAIKSFIEHAQKQAAARAKAAADAAKPLVTLETA